jgi:hypothetical protein
MGGRARQGRQKFGEDLFFFFLGLPSLFGEVTPRQGRKIVVEDLSFPAFQYRKFSIQAEGAAKNYSALGGTRACYATGCGLIRFQFSFFYSQ